MKIFPVSLNLLIKVFPFLHQSSDKIIPSFPQYSDNVIPIFPQSSDKKYSHPLNILITLFPFSLNLRIKIFPFPQSSDIMSCRIVMTGVLVASDGPPELTGNEPEVFTDIFNFVPAAPSIDPSRSQKDKDEPVGQKEEQREEQKDEEVAQGEDGEKYRNWISYQEVGSLYGFNQN